MYILWLLLLPRHTLIPVMVFLEADTKEILFKGVYRNYDMFTDTLCFWTSPYFIKLVKFMSFILNSANLCRIIFVSVFRQDHFNKKYCLFCILYRFFYRSFIFCKAKIIGFMIICDCLFVYDVVFRKCVTCSVQIMIDIFIIYSSSMKIVDQNRLHQFNRNVILMTLNFRGFQKRIVLILILQLQLYTAKSQY